MRVFPLSDHALVVEVGEAISQATHQRVRQVWRALESARLPGARELVPAYTTVTIFYDAIEVARAAGHPDRLCEFLEDRVRAALAARDSTEQDPAASRTVPVPVCYEPAFAPDPDEVARRTQVSGADVVRLHSGAEYDVHLLGFAPGFPYLGGLPPENCRFLAGRCRAPVCQPARWPLQALKPGSTPCPPQAAGT